MRITQRQSVLGILGLGTTITVIVAVIRLFTETDLLERGIALAALATFASLFGVYWRGWDPARYLLVVMITGLTIVAHQPGDGSGMGTLIGPILALVITGPIWVIASGAVIYSSLLIQEFAVYGQPVNLLTYMLAIGGLVLSRLVFETIVHQAEANARLASENERRAEAEAQVARQRADELEEKNQQQQQLFELVAVLETPIVSLADRVLFAPVVGHLDSRRAQALTARLLQAVSDQRTSRLILDITGVNAVDTQVAQALIRAVQALRLLGCEVTITGISPTVAATITQLGISFYGAQIARTPQEALAASGVM